MSKAQWIAENLKDGEQYAGLILGQDREPDYHLILLPKEVVGQGWDNCKVWAELQGGSLPTRREQSLLFANLKSQFEPAWYWSGEQYAASPSTAWTQSFTSGTQYDGRKSFEGRARAVRRLEI